MAFLTRFKTPYLSSLFWLFVLLGLGVIYGGGLQNELIFDDLRLKDEILTGFGQLFPIKPRMLSYGSFLWLQALVGESIWMQRLLTLSIHFGTIIGVWQFYTLLSQHTQWPQNLLAEPHFQASLRTTILFATLVFAFNPVAIYAVAYYVQRPIVMACFFTIWSWVFFVWGIIRKKTKIYFFISILAYLCAIFSKEQAVMAPTINLLLYIFIVRPQRAALIKMSLGVSGILIVAAFGFYKLYSHVIGQVFDETSKTYITQLSALSTYPAEHAWLLSIQNQSARFFQYGLLWFIPNPNWMSIDLRPAFPISLTELPQALGLIAYPLLLLGSVFALIRWRDWRSFLGLSLAIPSLLFCTEFATVWVQDPFVLYRSYLWALGIPGIVILLTLGMRPKVLLTLGCIIIFIFVGIAYERVKTLRTSLSAWTDAIEKIDPKAPPQAVGRWRPFSNRGMIYLAKGDVNLAQRDFESALKYGEIKGYAYYGLASCFTLQKKDQEALQAYLQAEKQGLTSEAMYFGRANIYRKLRQWAPAIEDYTRALSTVTDPEARTEMLQRRSDVAVMLGKFALAAEDLKALKDLGKQENFLLRYNLGMAYIGANQFEPAIVEFNSLIEKNVYKPAALYGRGLARAKMGQKDLALSDLDAASRIEPQNARITQLRQDIMQGRFH